MEGFLIAARFFHFVAVIMLTGVFAFEGLVVIPAFRQSGAALASAAGLRQRQVCPGQPAEPLALVSGAAWLAALASAARDCRNAGITTRRSKANTPVNIITATK